jgi:hypothetical protein
MIQDSTLILREEMSISITKINPTSVRKRMKMIPHAGPNTVIVLRIN